MSCLYFFAGLMKYRWPCRKRITLGNQVHVQVFASMVIISDKHFDAVAFVCREHVPSLIVPSSSFRGYDISEPYANFYKPWFKLMLHLWSNSVYFEILNFARYFKVPKFLRKTTELHPGNAACICLSTLCATWLNGKRVQSEWHNGKVQMHDVLGPQYPNLWINLADLSRTRSRILNLQLTTTVWCVGEGPMFDQK